MHNISKTFLSKLLLALAFFMSGIGISQEKDLKTVIDSLASNEDVKVGLVLSGGGAKGLAHIGVLKVIEEAGVRIDYIGGTSMGAVVGALYASGYSAKTLDSIFRAVDFSLLIQDDIPRNAKTFYEREDAEKYAVTLPFDDFKIGLPKGLSKGQNFFNQFSRYTAHVNEIHDFSKLPIPFFCITTNIETGEQVIMDKGYLPEVVSASGALPSVFEPFELDGILMTDGGVANNYPVHEVKKKGAEIVIGVDVQDSLMYRDELNSVTNIMLQISNFRTIKDMDSKIPETDVYIKPEVSDFSMLSFDQADQIIANGEKAATENYEKLLAIKNRQKPTKKTYKIPKNTNKLFINDILVSGNKRYTGAYIKGKLKLKTPKITTYKKLGEGINNLSATGNFDRISHKLERAPLGKKLLVNVSESENEMLLRFAIHYDDLYKTAALLNLTRKRLFFDNDVISFDAALGDNIRYNLDYYIDQGFYWSIGMKSSYSGFKKAIDYDVNLPGVIINTIDIDYTDFTIQAYAETLLKQTLSLGLGGEYKRLKIVTGTIDSGESNLPETIFDNSDYWSLFGYLKLDSYDNKYFPTKGILFDSDIHLYLLSSDFTKAFEKFSLVKARVGYATPLFRKTAINIELEGGSTIGNSGTSFLNFIFGGFGAKTATNFVPFYGYDFVAEGNSSYSKALFTFDYEFLKKNHVNISANFANLGSDLFSSGEWAYLPEYTGYALGYGLETFAGPIQVKYSYSPELKKSLWFFSIGFWF